MDYAQTRELVRLRYELRRVLAERPGHIDREAAYDLIRRIEALVSADEEEAKAVEAELARWELSLTVGS